MRRKWKATSLSTVFTLRNELHLLQQRAQVTRLRIALLQRGLTAFEAFQLFDGAKKLGRLSPGLLWAAVEWLDVPLTPEDVVDLVRTSDTDGDRMIGWEDFAHMLQTQNNELKAEDEAIAHLFEEIEFDPEVLLTPKGEEELAERFRDDEKKDLEEERQAAKAEQAVEVQRELELELEEERENQAKGLLANPLVDEEKAYFDFTTQKLPKKSTVFGFLEYRLLPNGRYAAHVGSKGYVLLPLPFSPNGRDSALNALNVYTVVLHLRLASLPPVRQALFRTGKPTSKSGAEISVHSDGSVGLGMYTGGKLLPNKWHTLAVAVDCSCGSLSLSIDGKQAIALSAAELGLQELLPDGALALKMDEGLAIFAAGDDLSMLGGDVQSVTIYQRALATMEVEDSYQLFAQQHMWVCNTCTFKQNPADASNCHICTAPRPTAPEGRAAEASKGNEHPVVGFLRDMGVQVTPAEVQAGIQAVGDRDVALLTDWIMHRKFQ